MATAYGGVTISPIERQGTVQLARPFPSTRSFQEVDCSTLSVQLVDDRGIEINAMSSPAVRSLCQTAPEKSLLHLTLDLAKLPPSSHLRWSVQVRTQDQHPVVNRPVTLSALKGLPESINQWLAPAPMIQSDHPLMRQVAAEIRAGAQTVQDVVSRTLQYIASHRRPLTAPDFQNDALSHLQTSFGECTAHGNLFAALLRANGVPCRVVTGIVVVRRCPSQNMHYQDEYYLPGSGWVRVEPQGLALCTPETQMVDTGVVYPSMEQRGRGFMHYNGVHQLSMIGHELDRDGRAVLPNDPHAKVMIMPGLPRPTTSQTGGYNIHLAD